MHLSPTHLIALVPWFASQAAGQPSDPVPLAGDHLLARAAGAQQLPSIAAGARGYLAVWEDARAAEADTAGRPIGNHARRVGGRPAVGGGAGVPFGDGLRCAGGSVRPLGVRTPDGLGNASWGPGLAGAGGWAAGRVRHLQVWYRDPLASPCGSGFGLSHGLTAAFAP